MKYATILLMTLALAGSAQAADADTGITIQTGGKATVYCKARSAITGRYVTKAYALANLSTTIFQCRRRR